MKNVKYLFFGLFIFIVIASFILPGYFLPSDILSTLPSFHKEQWIKPKNSLLGDSVFQFEPWRQYTKSRLLHGEFPLWNDQNSKGAAYFANMISSILYPLNIFYYIFPVHVSLYLIHFSKLFFLFLFGFLYFRALLCSKNMSLIGGFFVTFSAFPFVWLQWPQTNVFILFPLLLYITEKILQSRTDTYRWYVLMSIVYCMAIFGGHPETLFHIAAIHFCYIVFRLRNDLRKLLHTLIAITGGFLLGAVQLLPFIEYLFHSYALVERSQIQNDFFLPLKSAVLLVFPFLLGAPHTAFYRPILGTNFQEAIGGYVGIPVLFLGILGGLGFFGKNRIITFWTTTTVILFAVVYKIWPFYLLTQIPVFSVSANQRFTGFMAFGIAVIAVLTLQNLTKEKIIITQKTKKRILYLLAPLGMVLLLAIGLLPLSLEYPSTRESAFIAFLQIHLLALFLSVVTFLFFLWLLVRNKKKISPFILLIPIFLQTVALFWNYNPTTSQQDYYPKTELIRTLQNLPKGSVLEVGNPQLPQNLNLAYDLKHIENYDVLEIKAFKDKFNALFPDKNHWGKVDSVNEKHLRELGIAYVISDYDLRLVRQKIQTDQNKRLPLDSSETKIITDFKPIYSDLREVRIITANFNRENTCLVTISFQKKETKERIAESEIPCTNVNNNMFYSVTFKQAELHPGEEYQLIFQSPNASLDNSIALLGNSMQQPYLELLYEDTMNNAYSLLWSKNSIYLWKVSDVSNMQFNGKANFLIQRPEEKLIETSSQIDQRLHLKQPYYPGWEAKVDGKNTKLLNTNPFVAVDIPKGRHVVSFSYKPLSFYIGIIITLISSFVIFVYFLRNEIKQRDWKPTKVQKQIPWYQHVIVFTVGIGLSIATFTFLVKLFPISFRMPQTTAINWYTLHLYPRQQDYFYFYTSVVYVLSVTLLIWGIWIWKKSK